MNEPALTVICDAGPIIHLDEVNQLTLLADFSRILVPEQVWLEVQLHRPAALQHSVPPLEQIPVNISSQPTFQTLVKTLSLGIGEQAALSLMQIHPDSIFLTDDAAARLAAVTLGYRVHGSIGILLRAVRRQQLSRDEVTAILRALPEKSTLFIRPTLLAEIISTLEQAPHS